MVNNVAPVAVPKTISHPRQTPLVFAKTCTSAAEPQFMHLIRPAPSFNRRLPPLINPLPQPNDLSQNERRLRERRR